MWKILFRICKRINNQKDFQVKPFNIDHKRLIISKTQLNEFDEVKNSSRAFIWSQKFFEPKSFNTRHEIISFWPCTAILFQI